MNSLLPAERVMMGKSRLARAYELHSYDQLLAFVDRPDNDYTRADATRLWNTITANLPTNMSTFYVLDANNKQVLLNWYEQWLVATPYKPRWRNKRYRQGWRVRRALIDSFRRKYAEPTVPVSIDEYGPASRQLLADWLPN